MRGRTDRSRATGLNERAMSLFYVIPIACGVVAAAWLFLLFVGWLGTVADWLGAFGDDDAYPTPRVASDPANGNRGPIMTRYINVGSITALAGVIFGFVVLLFPDLGPGFKERATGVVTGAVTGLVGLLSLWDEIVAAYRARSTVPPQASSKNWAQLVLAMAALGAMAGGCATDPQMKVMQLRETRAAVLEIVATSYDAGLIDLDELAAIDKADDVVAAGLDVAEIAATAYAKLKDLAGVDPAVVDVEREKFRIALAGVRDGINRLIALRVEAERTRAHGPGNRDADGAATGDEPAGDLSAGEPPADGGGGGVGAAAGE